MTHSRLTDPEILEGRFPVWLEQLQIRCNSGGTGYHLGSNGVIRQIRFLQPVTAAILSGHRVVPSFGLAGGEPRAVGRNWIECADGSLQQLAGKAELAMQPENTFVIETPGGEGFGPQKR